MAALALSVSTSAVNWLTMLRLEAPIALSTPISRVRSRTMMNTAKMITRAAAMMEAISAAWTFLLVAFKAAKVDW